MSNNPDKDPTADWYNASGLSARDDIPTFVPARIIQPPARRIPPELTQGRDGARYVSQPQLTSRGGPRGYAGPVNRPGYGYVSKPSRHFFWDKWSKKRQKVVGALVASALVIGTPQLSHNFRAAEAGAAASVENWAGYKAKRHAYEKSLPLPVTSQVTFNSTIKSGATVSGLVKYTIDPAHIYEDTKQKAISVGVDVCSTDPSLLDQVVPRDKNGTPTAAGQKNRTELLNGQESWPQYVATFKSQQMRAEGINDMDRLAKYAIMKASVLTSTDTTRYNLENAESGYPILYAGMKDDPNKFNVSVGIAGATDGSPNQTITDFVTDPHAKAPNVPLPTCDS